MLSVLYTDNCSQLMNPINGTISCSLQYFPMILYKDTCSFTCNTGYKLTGSDTRTCQSNGSWSGSDVLCMRSAGNHTLITINYQWLTKVTQLCNIYITMHMHMQLAYIYFECYGLATVLYICDWILKIVINI